MIWESDAAPEPKDRTRLVWGGVVLLLLAMGLGLWFGQGKDGHRTRVRAKHILIGFDRTDPAERGRALERVTDLRKQILDGRSFSKIARNDSNDPGSAPHGGDLGWLERGSLTGEIEEYVWRAPLNELSEIIQTSYGFHLVIVTGREFSEVDLYERELRKRVFDNPDRSEESGEPESSS